MKESKKQRVVEYLRDLVIKGIDFADAEWSMTVEFDLLPKEVIEVRKAYDRKY